MLNFQKPTLLNLILSQRREKEDRVKKETSITRKIVQKTSLEVNAMTQGLFVLVLLPCFDNRCD